MGTCPVLKAFRKFDEGMTNSTSEANFAGLFQALGEDELEVGTHKFYADIAPEEVEYLSSSLSNLGVSSDGQLTYEKYKLFIEDAAVSTEVGQAPSNMISALLANRMDRWKSNFDVSELWSPRTCRARVAGEDPEKFTGETKSPKSPKSKGGKISPRTSSPRNKEEAPGSPRTSVAKKKRSSSSGEEEKDKKEKKKNGGKGEEEEEEPEKKDKKE